PRQRARLRAEAGGNLGPAEDFPVPFPRQHVNINISKYIALTSKFHFPGEALTNALRRMVTAFLWEEAGPTAVEYAVMLALIVVVCLAAITSLGTNANATFTSVSNALVSSS